MKEEIRTEWVRRLHSGTRKQGRGWLKSVDADGKAKYCCLGIVCEQAEEVGIVKSRINSGLVEFYDPSHPDDEWSDEVLPAVVWQWAEIGDENPEVTLANGKTETLAALNDNGMPFDEIGDLIADQL